MLLSLADGTSILTEGIYDNRFKYVNELRRMGAVATVDGRIAVFEGVEHLSPAPVRRPTCVPALRSSWRGWWPRASP